MIEGGEEFHKIMGFIEEQRGWPRRMEGEQVIIKVIPVRKASWGFG